MNAVEKVQQAIKSAINDAVIKAELTADTWTSNWNHQEIKATGITRRILQCS